METRKSLLLLSPFYFRYFSKEKTNYIVYNSHVYDLRLLFCAQNFTNLRSICLAGCVGFVSDYGVQLIVESSREKLCDIDLGGCKLITDVSLRNIAECCPYLERIMLVRCFEVSDKGLRYLASGCNQIKVIDLTHCGIGDLGLKYLAAGCRNIKKISLGFCPRVGDAGIEYLSEGCENITDIDLPGDVTDEGIIKLSRCCKKIRRASIRHGDIYDRGLMEFCSNLPNITVFALIGAAKITDYGFSELSKCQYLQSLTIIHSPMTDQGIEMIAEGCNDLRELDLECKQVTDIGVEALCKYCTKIRILSLSGCISLTNSTCQYVSLGLSQLRVLNLDRISNINYDGLLFIAQHSRQYQSLNITTGRNRNISTPMISSIQIDYPHIKIQKD